MASHAKLLPEPRQITTSAEGGWWRRRREGQRRRAGVVEGAAARPSRAVLALAGDTADLRGWRHTLGREESMVRLPLLVASCARSEGRVHLGLHALEGAEELVALDVLRRGRERA